MKKTLEILFILPFYYTSRNYYMWLVSTVIVLLPVIFLAVLLYFIEQTWTVGMKYALNNAWIELVSTFDQYTNILNFKESVFVAVSDEIAEAWNYAWIEDE